MAEHLAQMKLEHEDAMPVAGLSEAEQASLRERAMQAARACGWAPNKRGGTAVRDLFRKNARLLRELEADLYRLTAEQPSEDLRWLYDNLRLVRTDLQDLETGTKILAKLHAVRTQTDEAIPRPVVLARALLAAANYRLTEENFYCFIQAVEEIEALRLDELAAMLPALKLVLLELIAERGFKALNAFHAEGVAAPSFDVGRLIRSLRFIGEIDWKETIEQLSIIHRILLADPAGVYPRMDFESRNEYRLAVAAIAARSDVSEAEVARLAISMASHARVDRAMPDALRDRLRHAGYYLFDETGSPELLREVGYRPSLAAHIRQAVCRFPDEFYIIGIELVTLLTVVTLLMRVVRSQGGFGLIAGALLLILPATQAAVEVMNSLVTSLLKPRRLPKIDFSKGVDAVSATIVAIPTLLINEKQIRALVDDLEVRYLVNRDRNIFFALLTDLPDTAEPVGEYDARVDLVVSLIEGLNRKYAGEPYGGFHLFHRHRVYNPRERAWMGWERKRGKLLDLNQLLRGVYDPFPVKAGDWKRLPHIRYVLTLDSDTELPRGSAHKLIGAMTHPLNRPLIDPELNIVTQGYGILQPRVGISVHSATRSRLASIYSGQTGFDIYSRAVSDVYQDLYGEGIFTGKGIYDVDALRQVLEQRFPRNALLSHDLIEGAYARAGLASDIEVIDDYPSHYSAYNRRKHRWLRGDWQIVRWIFNTVPDESRRLVRNPISLVSRWKIVDNLRRSLMEPATFFLLIAGWFFLPGGPRFWTLTTLGLLFLPIYFRLLFSLIRSLAEEDSDSARESFKDFGLSHVGVLLNIVFLAHQALVALDAIVRTIIRSTVTHSRLLEWETATEAELGLRKRTPIDVYLDWVPVVAASIGLALWFKPYAIDYALPFTVAWCFSKPVTVWINRSPHEQDYELGPNDRNFLREIALKTWRYFSEFSNEKNNWLIPDNVQEEPYRVAERISPTNLGFLLNVRQAAVEFGFLTVSEFLEQTEKTLRTMSRMPRYIGHFSNWYDNITLKPLEPLFVSSVDSGNLIASLWSLKQGCLDMLRHRIIRQNAWHGLMTFSQVLAGKPEAAWKQSGYDPSAPETWLPQVLRQFASKSSGTELDGRIKALADEARRFMPWCLPEFEAVRQLSPQVFDAPKTPLGPGLANAFYTEFDRRLQAAAANITVSPETATLISRLRQQIPEARERMAELASRLQAIADTCERLAGEMNFQKLTDKRRRLLSVGYDAARQELAKSCYDLLASEARIATFIAVAKSEAEQETWFRLGRQHTICEGVTSLVSWTGTMFEYLMPVLWMNSQPNTLLDRGVRSAVLAQQRYAANRGVPWGISESAFSKTDPDGNYQYAAFGVPGLALNVARAGSLVISPYSSCLALMVDAEASLRNLRGMQKRKWLSQYGFYESADYTSYPTRRFSSRKYDLVRCWMAHHQGMTITALCNVLHNNPFQCWFHAEPVVHASELLLQERALRARPLADSQPRRVLSFTRNIIKGPAAKVRTPA
ncbi:MAG: glycosyl transferase [Acidobacteriaceae bacterium]|nr:glycosyl transferase [Acidobacteriaceae bacterium]